MPVHHIAAAFRQQPSSRDSLPAIGVSLAQPPSAFTCITVVAVSHLAVALSLHGVAILSPPLTSSHSRHTNQPDMPRVSVTTTTPATSRVSAATATIGASSWRRRTATGRSSFASGCTAVSGGDAAVDSAIARRLRAQLSISHQLVTIVVRRLLQPKMQLPASLHVSRILSPAVVSHIIKPVCHVSVLTNPLQHPIHPLPTTMLGITSVLNLARAGHRRVEYSQDRVNDGKTNILTLPDLLKSVHHFYRRTTNHLTRTFRLSATPTISVGGGGGTHRRDSEDEGVGGLIFGG
ncbi:hypothetical protein STAS_23295 [Striga asiatica]|uniref:Uncharacterized protein n=1 Tax=Striga asiatica TaxID=4170 RepID=A0A5A7QMC3_STRAF|nr:hypothetical protein STAS_23295 [Striga asiatica]